MKNKSEHDVRLVYLACAYILAHRGHFLFSVDKDNAEKITDFAPLHEGFLNAVENICKTIPFDSDREKVSEILRSDKTNTDKSNCLTELWFGGKKPAKDMCAELNYEYMIKLICGNNVKLSDLFLNENYKELEKNSITVSSADFSETLDALYGALEDDEWELLSAVKKLSDWSLLVRSLGEQMSGESVSVSKAKVDVYNAHKNDLRDLKYICRKYLSEQQCYEIFKDTKSQNNYCAYIGKNCNAEDFCKFIEKILEKITPDSSDGQLKNELINKCKNLNLCPKQKTTDNRVIPYQLYYAELKRILENASAYLPFLNDKDDYGTTADKILSIMEFRIPYYVGPLVSKSKSSFAWMKRKAEGKIYPWNFEEKVDLDESENLFIKRMTGKCTYLAGADVLPKNSLLYSKFNVLNEINNITVDGVKISVGAKQMLYNELFMKKQRVTLKAIENALKSCGELKDGQSVGGIDTSIKSSLKSYLDFKKFLETGVLKEADAEKIIERITATTDTQRLQDRLEKEYPVLNHSDAEYLSRLNYKDYGRLSGKLLEEIFEIDADTSEVLSDRNIITALWETNDNLMQILGSKYKYGNAIEQFNNDYYSDPQNHTTIEKRMENMYIPTAVRRSVTRTLDIIKEIKSVIGKDPDKIFIEMARENDPKNKGRRTSSRREQIKALFKSAKDIADKERLNELSAQLESTDDGRLRSEKYYLYFTQLGKCMYTGRPIDFERLGNDTYYNIDHIYPQAKVKDDSLENKVLVESEANGIKKDNLVPKDFRDNMRPFWISLKSKGLISEKKYQRLIKTEFTPDELAGFIARQLVETRQSTKAVAEIIKEICPNSKIVYVKAGLTSDFRQETDMLKCREVNDLHHAKDAYLNIVIGNVYNTQFTDNPLNFVQRANQKDEQYSIKVYKRSGDGKESGLLTRRVERGGNVAWDPSVSFDTVNKMMNKNSVRYVRYCYRRKGGFFDQMPESKKEGLAERKKGLDPAKYGGYNSTTASYFTLVKHDKSIVFVPVELMFADKFSSDTEFAKKYIAKQLSHILGKETEENKITFPLGSRPVKINSMLEIDGFKGNIVQKSNKGRTLVIASCVSLVLDKAQYDYAKTISSFVAKYKEDKKRRADDYIGICKEKNAELFDVLAGKALSAPFNTMLGKIGAKVKNGKENFENLSLTEQTIALANILSLLKTGRSSSCDLTLIGESKQAGVITINSDISKLKDRSAIYIIDQSPTGLYEKRSPNLLKL